MSVTLVRLGGFWIHRAEDMLDLSLDVEVRKWRVAWCCDGAVIVLCPSQDAHSLKVMV
jgi:hypothetical protein